MGIQRRLYLLWILKMSIHEESDFAFWKDESGQDLIEYALVVGLIALGAVASMKGLATSINNFWYIFLAKMAAAWP